MNERKGHWENIYKTRDHKTVGWYQEIPKISLELLSKINARDEQSIIDVGCGASLLVDNLISQGYKNISLLDLSDKALASIKSRLGDKGNIPRYYNEDIASEITFKTQFDIWHDRAVFHFLTSSEDREMYMKNLENNLSPSGHAIIGTFSVNGPEKCSGLDVVQYNELKMAAELHPNLKIQDTIISTHIMPNGNKQEYMYFIITNKAVKK